MSPVLAQNVSQENVNPEPAAKMQKVSPAPDPPLLVKKLSEDATLPKRGSSHAAGYDLARHVLPQYALFVGLTGQMMCRLLLLSGAMCSIWVIKLDCAVPALQCQGLCGAS